MNHYGTLELVSASPASGFTEPLTLQQVKEHLNLPERNDPGGPEELLIESFIAGAREQAEIMQGRDLIMKRWALHLDYFYAHEICLREKLHSVQSVTRKDSDGVTEVLTESADYIVDTKKQPGIIMPPYGGSWPSFTPWPTSAITVSFTAGTLPNDVFWEHAGQRVLNGMRLLISAWFNGRLPFELGANVVTEYPFAVTSCLSYGAVPRAR